MIDFIWHLARWATSRRYRAEFNQPVYEQVPSISYDEMRERQRQRCD